MIIKANIATPQSGGSPRLVLASDMASFNEHNVRPHSLDACKVLVVAGVHYPLHPACPDAGLPLYDAAAVEAEEESRDAAIMALPASLRADLGLGDHKPLAVRKARRALDDARADRRAATTPEARDAATLAVQAARAALDAAKLAAGIVEPEADDGT